MEVETLLQKNFGSLVSLEEVAPNVRRIYAPFFHEDGDMISMYLEQTGDSWVIRDFGNTLMRVSYTFDMESKNKLDILNGIVKSNYGRLENGELLISATMENLVQSIFQFTQLVAKVSNIDILRRETVKSLFFENLADCILSNAKKYAVESNFTPTRDRQLIVDYRLTGDHSARPLFVFGINENTKASKTVISCFNFQKQHIPFRSLIIHEDFESLSTFYRNQITNTADKQFTSLEDFKAEGFGYIDRELAS